MSYQADLTGVTWRRGSGYDLQELKNVLTANDLVIGVVIDRVRELVTEPSRMRALGFCVSVEHARFMAARCSKAGIPSVAIWAETPLADRRAALTDLRAGRVN